MSVTFSGVRYFTAPANSVILSDVTQGSISFFFRYDGDPAASNGCNVIQNLNHQTFGIYGKGAGSQPGTMVLEFKIINSTPASATAQFTFAVGVIYHIALTYDQGTQTVWINDIPTVIGTLTGPTRHSTNIFFIGTASGLPGCGETLDALAIWNDYVLTATDVRNLRDGTQTPDQIGGAATWQGYWTLAGPAGATVALGDRGLANSLGTLDLTGSGGAGTAVYAAPLVWVPTIKVKQASVWTSGELAVFFLEGPSHQAAIPIQSITAPTIFKNGVSLGPLTDPWITGYHACIAYKLPAGTSVAPGDTITFTAPAGWLNTDMGMVVLMDNLAGTNYAGRSGFGTESLTKTLKMGVNFPHLGTASGSTYQVLKNWRQRTVIMQPATLATGGKPLAITGSGTEAAGTIYDQGSDNEIDATQEPGAVGLYAVGLDDLNPSTPTESVLATISSSTTITERSDLRNYGSGGLGKVRVLDVQRAVGSTSAAIKFSLYVINAARTPQFDNLVIYGPGDFSYQDGVPVVLDKSDPYALSSTFLDRLKYPPGSTRWMDSTTGYGGYDSTPEPEELRCADDFAWTGYISRRYLKFGYTQARPFSLPSYIYATHFGTSYSATLADPIDDATTTLQISDAEAAPVLIGLRLKIDDELMRVQDVSGTTVTVERGASMTTPTAHSAGTIQVQNRLEITSLSQITSPGQITELVTDAPHQFRTGQTVYWSGTWPTFTYTDGSVFAFTGQKSPVYVTGPNSYIVGTTRSLTPTSPPVTLPAPVTLDPVAQYTEYYGPSTGFPYEIIAKVTARLSGTELHVNVPHAASDACVEEIARRVRDNFPAGRKVWVEWSNEPWNFFMPSWVYSYQVSRLLYPGGFGKEWQALRSGQIWQIFRDVFNEGGRNRGGEINGLLNVQIVDPGPAAANSMLAFCRAHGFRVGGIATANYVSPENSAASKAARNAMNNAQVLDLWILDLYYNRGGSGGRSYTAIFKAHTDVIAAHNKLSGDGTILYGYEGGSAKFFQSGETYYLERQHDCQYHPNLRIIEQDMYAFFQNVGFQRANIYGYSMPYVEQAVYGLYHWINQPYGMGDGSDGKADNRLCLAQPGLPHSKDALTNQDLQNVSVRGQALLDWNWAAGSSGRRHRFGPYRRLSIGP